MGVSGNLCIVVKDVKTMAGARSTVVPARALTAEAPGRRARALGHQAQCLLVPA